MAIDLTHQFKIRIEKSKTYQSLTGTDKFKQNLLSKNYKNIFHDYEQAKRLGVEYVAQYITSSIELKIIKELIEDDRNQEK
jgi:hypothetical protein